MSKLGKKSENDNIALAVIVCAQVRKREKVGYVLRIISKGEKDSSTICLPIRIKEDVLPKRGGLFQKKFPLNVSFLLSCVHLAKYRKEAKENQRHDVEKLMPFEIENKDGALRTR